MAAQQTEPKEIDDLTLDEVANFMKKQFDPKRFAVREKHNFWSDMTRKPGQTIHELAARTRQRAATCDFPSIKDPLDDAISAHFICSVNNEAVIKACFSAKTDKEKCKMEVGQR